uniref:Protein kinase domain-containing protein n=1 Tax=Paramoeba aestuarina TaxID=180227 RepID=A0A7S4NXC8_9EUKA|mmetsp:Transcript_31853/g.49855  ORF Transcript_31853/g.49855 Transcript_31853/m.49855 type:complete len:392 (+) Transcript_31853:87-1262(+)
MGGEQSKRKGIAPESFRVAYPLSEGSYGTIWKVTLRDTKEEFSMKSLPLSIVAKEKLMDNLLLEREIMLKIGKSHPFITSLSYAFVSTHAIHFIMPKQSKGSLFTLLRNRPEPFSEAQAQFYMAEVVLALAALHSNNYVYRDLKLENVCLTPDGHIRLHDFGFSRSATPPLKRVHSFSGPNIYISPEILLDEGEGHSFSVDWWGLGIFFHLLLTQTAPFWAEKNEELFYLIKEGEFPDLKQHCLSDSALSLLSELLTRNPKKRLGSVPPIAYQTEKDTEGDDSNPKGAKYVQQHPFFQGLDWDLILEKKFPPPLIPSTLRTKEQINSPPPFSLNGPPLTPEFETYLRSYEGMFHYDSVAEERERKEKEEKEREEKEKQEKEEEAKNKSSKQ